MESIRPPGLPAVAAVSTAGRVPALALAGFGLLVLVRALTLPGSLWEFDEMLFALSLERFEPWAYHPHPPGYPLLVGLGNLFEIAFRDPFRSLVALSFVSSLVSYPALVSAFRRIAGSGQVAVAGALLFLLSPVMLVQGPLPMSDPPSLMFLCLALAAAAGLAAAAEDGGAASAIALGACASAAVGCRPQHAVAVIPMLVVALWRVPRRRRAEALAAFTLVSLLWLVPLVRATGGPRGFLDYQVKQAAQVAEHDATASRKGRDPIAVASRFVLNGWGPRWLALPVLGLAIAGTVRLRRRRASLALPLAVLSLTHLAFCLGAMDPGDGARYALPFLLGMAFAAAVGCEAAAERARRPGLGWIPAGAVVAVSILYTSPVLAARASPSPPVQAAEWATRHLRPGAILLVSPEMEPHAGYLLRRFKRAPVEEGLRYAARHPKAAVYLLAEGESGWEGAQTFRWPDSKAYHRVTRNHYRVVSLSPVPASRRFQIVRGVSGWGPDGDVRRARWRWMDADAAIRIFPRRARAAFVTLGLERSGPSPVTVEISVNGAPAARVEIAHGVQRRVEVALPAAKAVEIAFRSTGAPLQLFMVETDGR